MTPKTQRFVFIAVTLGCLCGAVALILFAFRDRITYFYAPSDPLPHHQHIRLGGVVKTILPQEANQQEISFVLTDYVQDISVTYYGVLPDLFREGQGAVTEGKWDGHTFSATRVLAKHDENYMPPEVAESLKKKGLWRTPSLKDTP